MYDKTQPYTDSIARLIIERRIFTVNNWMTAINRFSRQGEKSKQRGKNKIKKRFAAWQEATVMVSSVFSFKLIFRWQKQLPSKEVFCTTGTPGNIYTWRLDSKDNCPNHAFIFAVIYENSIVVPLARHLGSPTIFMSLWMSLQNHISTLCLAIPN